MNKTDHPLYSTWKGMKQRCYNKSHPSYDYYGRRGIFICERWINDFHAFFSDMGTRPENCTIDRIDNDGPYSPDNCRWATRKEQQRNRRITVFVTVDSIRYNASELAEKAGIKIDTIIGRAARGLPINKVLSKDKLHNLEGLKLGGKANGLRNRAKTHCKNGHKFTKENTSITKEGWRRCKRCHSIRESARKKDK